MPSSDVTRWLPRCFALGRDGNSGNASSGQIRPETGNASLGQIRPETGNARSLYSLENVETRHELSIKVLNSSITDCRLVQPTKYT